MTPVHPVREDYDCLPLPAFDAGDFHAVRAAFRGAMPIPLTQAWLDQPEPDFAPGTVRTGWREDSLLVFAELVDDDIFTRARGTTSDSGNSATRSRCSCSRARRPTSSSTSRRATCGCSCDSWRHPHQSRV